MVDRRDSVLAVELVDVGNGVEPRRRVRLEEVLLERPREQIVVEPEEDVAFRIPLRQQGAVERDAGVARLEDAQAQARFFLERGADGLRDDEGVVGDEHDLRRLGRVVATAATDQRKRRQKEREPLHAGVPGLTASRTPLSSATRASDAAKTFETPRLEPGSSVSPASGYSRPSVVTPCAAPWSAWRESSSPGVPASVRVRRITCTRAAPSCASSSTCA